MEMLPLIIVAQSHDLAVFYLPPKFASTVKKTHCHELYNNVWVGEGEPSRKIRSVSVPSIMSINLQDVINQNKEESDSGNSSFDEEDESPNAFKGKGSVSNPSISSLPRSASASSEAVTKTQSTPQVPHYRPSKHSGAVTADSSTATPTIPKRPTKNATNTPSQSANVSSFATGHPIVPPHPRSSGSSDSNRTPPSVPSHPHEDPNDEDVPMIPPHPREHRAQHNASKESLEAHEGTKPSIDPGQENDPSNQSDKAPNVPPHPSKQRSRESTPTPIVPERKQKVKNEESTESTSDQANNAKTELQGSDDGIESEEQHLGSEIAESKSLDIQEEKGSPLKEPTPSPSEGVQIDNKELKSLSNELDDELDEKLVEEESRERKDIPSEQFEQNEKDDSLKETPKDSKPEGAGKSVENFETPFIPPHPRRARSTSINSEDSAAADTKPFIPKHPLKKSATSSSEISVPSIPKRPTKKSATDASTGVVSELDAEDQSPRASVDEQVSTSSETRKEASASTPVIPNRPLKRASTDSTNSHSYEHEILDIYTTDSPVKETKPVLASRKGPPPVPKKPSSKIAAFQAMLRQNQQQEQEAQSPRLTDSSEEKEPVVKANPDRAAFKKNLTGLFALPGMALPGMAPPGGQLPAALRKSNDDSQSTTEEGNTDVRKGRARGPRGKRLPKTATQTIEVKDRRTLTVIDIWSSGSLKSESGYYIGSNESLAGSPPGIDESVDDKRDLESKNSNIETSSPGIEKVATDETFELSAPAAARSKTDFGEPLKKSSTIDDTAAGTQEDEFLSEGDILQSGSPLGDSKTRAEEDARGFAKQLEESEESEGAEEPGISVAIDNTTKLTHSIDVSNADSTTFADSGYEADDDLKVNIAGNSKVEIEDKDEDEFLDAQD